MVHYSLNKIKLASDEQYKMPILTLLTHLLSGLWLEDHWIGYGLRSDLPGLGLKDHWPWP